MICRVRRCFVASLLSSQIATKDDVHFTTNFNIVLASRVQGKIYPWSEESKERTSLPVPAINTHIFSLIVSARSLGCSVSSNVPHLLCMLTALRFLDARAINWLHNWNDLVSSSLGSIVGTANTTARRHVWQHYQYACHVWSLADRLQFGLGGNSPAFHEHRRRSACRRTTIYLIFDDFLLGFVKMVLFIAFSDCSRWVDAPGVSNFWKYPIFDWEKNYLPLRTN